MGIDLYSVGNHQIKFAGRSYKEIAEEIKFKLDNLRIDYQSLLSLPYFRTGDEENSVSPESLSWNYSVNEFSGAIEFTGPYELEISFNYYSIEFCSPCYRYYEWFEMEVNQRDIWRKYFHQILKSFGGDRLMYFPDNAIFLDYFLDSSGSFEKKELRLQNRYGPAVNFSEEVDDYYRVYFIDRFYLV
ncbi:MAG: hypothetical protein GX660_03830 [Clostridiaceae bacterium]|nr:hypothetical protein [Clostridiaceae bacterium]